MPKFMCECGSVIRYSDIPCELEYKFISDVEYDKYEGSINAEELYLKMESFFKCPDCNRLWMFWNGFKEAPSEYLQITNENKQELSKMKGNYTIWIEAEEWAEGQWDINNDNTDVIVQFENGTRWVASFYTYSNIIKLAEKNKQTGENLGGKYLWGSDMLLVDEVSRERIEEVVQELISKDELKSVFKKSQGATNGFLNKEKLFETFKIEPVLLNENEPWEDNCVSYIITCKDERVIFEFDTYDGNLHLTWYQRDSEITKLYLNYIENIEYEKQKKKEFINIFFDREQNNNTLSIQISPMIKLSWGL